MKTAIPHVLLPPRLWLLGMPVIFCTHVLSLSFLYGARFGTAFLWLFLPLAVVAGIGYAWLLAQAGLGAPRWQALRWTLAVVGALGSFYAGVLLAFNTYGT